MFSRPLLLGACALVAVGGLVAHPTWARSAGVDVWNVPTLEKQIRAAQSEMELLESADDEVLQRIAVKEMIVAELLAERIGLAEASEQFTALNAARPDLMATIRATFPGGTDREKMAYNVITYALLRVGPDQRTATAGRLEAERVRILGAGAAP